MSKLPIPANALAQHLRYWFRIPAAVTAMTPVVRLFLWGGPSAVPRSVWTIIVFAVDGVRRRRPRPHVAQKRLEVAEPFGTNRNTAQSVFQVVRSVRIQAAVLHPLPRGVFRRIGQAVRARGLGRALALKAAAGLDFPAQMILSYARLIATIAQAYPCAMPCADPLCFIEHDESAESLAS